MIAGNKDEGDEWYHSDGHKMWCDDAVDCCHTTLLYLSLSALNEKYLN